MRRSKLETYIDILKVLSFKGPLKSTHIMYKANVNFSALKEQLNFLTKQGLVEERKIGKTKVAYALTPRGRTVLMYFHELKQALPIIEESRKQTATPY